MELETGKIYKIISGTLFPNLGSMILEGSFLLVVSIDENDFLKIKYNKSLNNDAIVWKGKLKDVTLQEVTQKEWRSSIKDTTFRLMIQRENDRKLESIKLTETEIEKASMSQIIGYYCGAGHFLLAKDRFTGVFDEKYNPIFEGDIIECTDSYTVHNAVVRFGEYNQDGSGGEYSPRTCIGFYADAIKPNQLDEDGYRKIHEFDQTTSLLYFSKLKIIGNIWQNPELIERGAE